MIEPTFYDHLTAHWPAICVAAAWMAHQARAAYHALFDLLEYVMSHGGIKSFLRKLWDGGAK